MAEPDDARIYRDALHAAMDALHVALRRGEVLEAQLAALREELRRYVAARVGADG